MHITFSILLGLKKKGVYTLINLGQITEENKNWDDIDIRPREVPCDRRFPLEAAKLGMEVPSSSLGYI